MIAQYYPPDVGGASTRVSNLQRILLESGHQVIVIAALPHYQRGDIPSIFKRKPFVIQREGKLTVIRTWIPGVAHSSAVLRLILYLSFSFSALFAIPLIFGKRFAAVWALSPNYFCMIPGLIYGKIWRVPVIHDVVDVWPAAIFSSGYSFPKPFLRPFHLLLRASYILADVVVTLTGSIRRSILVEAPSISAVWVIPNAVEDTMFGIPLRDESSSTFHAVYLGTLAPSNDFPMIIEAARLLRDRDSIRFKILGAGECEAEISRLIREYNLDNVTMDAKPVRHDEVPKRLSDADALILPLKKGFEALSFPSKLGEYLASGRPVICSAEGDLADLIRGEEIGLIIPYGSSKELAETILTLKEDRFAGTGLGAKARRYAAANLSSQQMTTRVRELLAAISQNDYRTLANPVRGRGA